MAGVIMIVGVEKTGWEVEEDFLETMDVEKDGLELHSREKRDIFERKRGREEVPSLLTRKIPFIYTIYFLVFEFFSIPILYAPFYCVSPHPILTSDYFSPDFILL